MSKEMLINVVAGEECRIAVVSNGVLEELYMERASNESQVGNIYKGRVTNVEPSIQAAFIDFGAPKHGFLHISDLQPQYFPAGQRATEPVGMKRARKDRPPIQKCLRRGQEVICQITKEGIGTKGPTLTTYLSIPGRFLVMMPGMTRHGVSRKIEDEEARARLRSVLEEIGPPKEMGFIVRTAGVGRTKRDLQNDLNYLLRLWQSVDVRIGSSKAPAELYQESDLVIRTIRDVYSSEISRVLCDSEQVTLKVADFLHVAMPRGKRNVSYYRGATPLFHCYDLEREIEKIYSRRVELPGGGSLVIDQTEALVAIDVNSGRYRSSKDAEDTAYRTNLTAAKEICRQLRLRDMGGLLVIDFIDMRHDRHRREVETVLRDGLKNDRARSKTLRISRLGLLEMTRQRVRPSLKLSIYRECPSCSASGLIKSDESMALAVMRYLQLVCSQESVAAIELTVSARVADYINNRRRKHLLDLERRAGKSITVRSDPTLAGDAVLFQCSDARGGIIPWRPTDEEMPAFRNDGAGARHTGPPAKADLVDVANLTRKAPPEVPPLAELPETPPEAAPAEGEEAPAAAPTAKRRRGGRKRRRAKAAPAEAPEADAAPAAEEPPAEAAQPAERPPGDAAAPPAEAGAPPAEAGAEKPPKKRRRRGGRKHRRNKKPVQDVPAADIGQLAAAKVKAPAAAPQPPTPKETPAAEAAKAAKTPAKAKAAKRPAKTAKRPAKAAKAKAKAAKKSPRRRTTRRKSKAASPPTDAEPGGKPSPQDADPT